MLTVNIHHCDLQSPCILRVTAEGRDPAEIQPGTALAYDVEPGTSFQVAVVAPEAAVAPSAEPAAADVPAPPEPTSDDPPAA